MSGHSKWANIKHKKAAADAKKGKVFSKLAKEIMIAVSSSGADPSANIRLRLLLQKARAANMPSDNVERAIKKGTGELGGAALEEVMFEGFAPGGVQLVVEALTDNRNRTVAEVRHLFNRHGGKLGNQGSVIKGFQRKGHIVIEAGDRGEDELMMLVLEAGAEDFKPSGEERQYDVITDPSQYAEVAENLGKAGLKEVSSELELMPTLMTPITDKETAEKVMKFIDDLEELDDVQNVYSNLEIDDALMDSIEGE